MRLSCDDKLHEEALEKAVLIKRYKRFLCDVQLSSGAVVVAHCPNPGAMTGLADSGTIVYLRHSTDPRRKLAYTWVLSQAEKSLVTIDAMMANKLVARALELNLKLIPELESFEKVERERTFLDSRFDFQLCGNRSNCFMEVKSTTLADGPVAMFPDCPTARGRKHLESLSEARRQGIRAVQYYCVMRSDVTCFKPAASIDPAYALGLARAVAEGVEVIARIVSAQEVAPGRFQWSQGQSLEVALD